MNISTDWMPIADHTLVKQEVELVLHVYRLESPDLLWIAEILFPSSTVIQHCGRWPSKEQAQLAAQLFYSHRAEL